MIATHLQTGKTRLLLPYFGELLGAGPDYVYELKSDQTGSEQSGWTLSKRDLSSGEILRGMGNAYDPEVISFSGGLHDGYAYLSALHNRDGPWFTVFRFVMDDFERATPTGSIPYTLVPIDFHPGDLPLKVTAHAVTDDGLYFAASFGAGSVLYRVPLPPDTRSPATLVP